MTISCTSLIAAAVLLTQATQPVQLAPGANGNGRSEPSYPLGGSALANLTETATPLRLVDFRYRFLDAGSRESVLESRAKLQDWGFIGAEVSAGRKGAFFDTARTEIGVTEQSDDWTLEGAIRSRRVIARLNAEHRARSTSSSWKLEMDTGIRLSPDLELLFGYGSDLDDRNNEAPSLENFVASGTLPALGPTTRILRRGNVGLLYQRRSQFELETHARIERLRSEAGFDFSQQAMNARTLWNREPLELESSIEIRRATGRLARVDAVVSIDAKLRLFKYLLAHAGTEQHWERGISRFARVTRGGASFFGREHRFVRTGATAENLERLIRKAYDLGYSERRVYTLSELRALRERLALSKDRGELGALLRDLYRSQVEQRNLPQLGFEIAVERNDFLNMDARQYRLWLGIPWRPTLPWSRDERRVEFLRLELSQTEQRFPGNIVAISKGFEVQLFLNREVTLRAGWMRPGRVPIEIARRTSRARRITLELDYALGQ